MTPIILKGKFIDHPLRPDVLSALGVINAEMLPAFHNDSDKKTWHTKFIIWTTDGYIKTKNKYLGELSLARMADGDNQSVLDIEQIYYNAGKVNHRIKTKLICRNNTLASPVSWQLSSTFLDHDDIPVRNDTNIFETVQVAGNELITTVSEGSFKRKVSGNFTSDWSLFSTIGQLPFDNSVQYKFDLLEGLRRFRENNRLFYKTDSGLHHFRQYGAGILPYDYWLNDTHQLLMVITGNRAYIPVELISENWKKDAQAKDDDE